MGAMKHYRESLIAPMGRSYRLNPGQMPMPEKTMGKDFRPSPRVRRFTSPAEALLPWRPQAYAASAPFAFSASAAKPTASCTAISASTLRSRVMPAFIRPLMKRL